MKPFRFHFRKNHNNRFKSASPSQALLEFALALPILLMLLFGIIDLAALFQAWLTVENIARQTVRYAVTGQYDPTFCTWDSDDAGTVACEGDKAEEEQEYARLLSIKEFAERQKVALFLTPGAAQDKIGHMNIIICSNADIDGDTIADYTFFPPSTPDYSDCQRAGSFEEHAGGPNDRVIVSVDFNHPYITPFFNQVWPMTHLFAFREGIVEAYRAPRLIALPATLSLPTLTPSPTPIPPTAMPLHIEIVVPVNSGEVITSVEQTRFEAEAWDPEHGTSNGDGIQNIRFWFTGPAFIPGTTEGVVAYCAFVGNTPCPTMDNQIDHTTLPGGTYTIHAEATASDDGATIEASKTFVLQFPATPTPTLTSTPTATPTPNCSNIYSHWTRTIYDNYEVGVQNDNLDEATLTGSVFDFTSPYSPPMYFNLNWMGWTYYNPPDVDIYSGSVNWTGTGPEIPGNSASRWVADFDNGPQPPAGSFSAQLTFTYANWGDCVVNSSLDVATPTATAIPTNTATPTTAPTATEVVPIDCDLISASASRSGDDIRLNVTNNNPVAIVLLNSSFNWDKNWSDMYVDYFRWGGTNYWGGNDDTPNTSNIAPSSTLSINAGSSALWSMDFDFHSSNKDIWGSFTPILYFDDGSGGQCPIFDTVVVPGPDPTQPATPIPTTVVPPPTNIPSATSESTATPYPSLTPTFRLDQ